MYSFLIAVSLLILGYSLYGGLVNRIFSPNDRLTPANEINDGVDYVPMPTWKVFLIQLLNIAGTGPIFGALSGAVFGPVVYIWIVFGCIFGGAVYDFFIGMISVRHKGASISEITGFYLGNGAKLVMRVFSIILLVMCGVVFTTGPAELLAAITPEFLTKNVWLIIILVYFFIATFLPIDKVIGHLYPFFGICLVIMALGVSGSLLFSGKFQMPEVWNNFTNLHPQGTNIWPFMLITVACGAISGFHSTQSPMMARCIKHEKHGKRVFYGAMIAEGIIALIWAAAGVSVYPNTQALLEAGGGCSDVVYYICQTTMGKVGMILALIGVIICPISSGDTAYRSARLTIADWFKTDQSKWKNRLIPTICLLVVGAIICQINYSIVWRYFSWANQTLAAIGLWAICVYLVKNNKHYIITLIPAAFMSALSITYFFCAKECLGGLFTLCGLTDVVYYPIAVIAGIVIGVTLLIQFLIYVKKHDHPLIPHRIK